jgi:hypothetical protein
LNSNGEVLHANVTILRDHMIVKHLKELELRGPHKPNIMDALGSLKSMLNNTSRLWHLNLNIIGSSTPTKK